MECGGSVYSFISKKRSCFSVFQEGSKSLPPCTVIGTPIRLFYSVGLSRGKMLVTLNVDFENNPAPYLNVRILKGNRTEESRERMSRISLFMTYFFRRSIKIRRNFRS